MSTEAGGGKKARLRKSLPHIFRGPKKSSFSAAPSAAAGVFFPSLLALLVVQDFNRSHSGRSVVSLLFVRINEHCDCLNPTADRILTFFLFCPKFSWDDCVVGGRMR